MDPPPFASVGTSNQQVNPWNYVINEVIKILDASELQVVLNYVQGTVDDSDDDDDNNSAELSEDEKVKQMFVKKMNEETNFRDTTKRLQAAFDFLNFHEKGEKLSSIVNDFLKEYYPEEQDEQQEIFVGRDEEIKRITKAFTEGSSKCVIISGPGGQGKTTLAKHVCQHLNWPCTFTADMRDKNSISDLAKIILLNNRQIVSSSELEVIKDLKLFLKNLQVDALIFVDHCDMLFRDDNKAEVDNFLDEFLGFLQQDLYVKVCFLMTSVVRFDPKKTAKLVKQIELDSLEKPAAVELLCKSSGEDIQQIMAEKIVTECACSPLAVTTAASMIREKKFTINRLLFHLKMDEKNVTNALQVSNCMKIAIDSLDDEVKESLFRLVVFKGSSFKKNSADQVLKSSESSEHLLKLKKAHLLHFRKSLKSELDPSHNKKRRGTYSLHSLVYKYIHECIQRGELSSIEEAIRDAKRKFVKLYEGKISSLMFDMDTRIVKGMKSLEFHKTHIKQFFSILENEKPVLEPYPKQSKPKEFLKKKRMFDLADLLIPDVQKRRLYKSEAARAKGDGNSAMCIHWTVEEAEVYLLSADKPSLAKDLLDGLSENYPALKGLHEHSVYPHLVHALFHKVKGLTLWKLQKPQEGLQHLSLSLKFYEHFNKTDPEEERRCDANYVCLHARVYSSIGQIYIELENFDAAIQALEKGNSMIKKIMDSSQEADSEMQRDIPRFYAKFGHILLKKAQIEKDPKQRVEYLDDALEQLNKGMNIDRKLKMDHFELYNVKQKLKADVLIEKGDYEQALREAEAALGLRRAILQPPHFKYLESVYQVAKIYLLIGNRYAGEAGKEEARKWWLTARDYFKEMEEHHLVNGSIQVGHPLLKEIKHNHLDVRRLYDGENSESVEEVVQFYQKLEKGKFKSRADSHLESFEKMLQTPGEFVKQLFGSGGEQFGEKEIRTEVSEIDPCEQIQRMRDGNYGVNRQDSGDASSSSEIGGSESSEESISAYSQKGQKRSVSAENKGCSITASSADNEENIAKSLKTFAEDR